MVEFVLIASLGFLGSFGHCVGMCGPIAIAFSLAEHQTEGDRWHRFRFNVLLNLGRITSYTLVGAGIGAIGSLVVAGGQLAGVGSSLRQSVTIVMGLLLIWLGLTQISPQGLPKLPLVHLWLERQWHDRLSRRMMAVAMGKHWWTPVLLGLVWGWIPCGFLYTAQIKAAETSSLWQGGLTLLAFGLGTVPVMLGVGTLGHFLNPDRRRQLFRLGGWITLLIGILTLVRSGTMVDYTGHLAVLCLALALVARPLCKVMPGLLRSRRVLGVSAFGLAVAHVGHLVSMGWDLAALPFLLPPLQVGTWAGIAGLTLLVPLAGTSFDWAQKRWGDRWRWLHLLGIPAFVLVVLHVILLGSHYLGAMVWTWQNWAATVALGSVALGVLLLRQRWIWTVLLLDRLYGVPLKAGAVASNHEQ